jgi:glycosyltransferase involved in cell wall biosynthesis
MKYPEEKIVITTGGINSGPFVEWGGIKHYPGATVERQKGDLYMPNVKPIMAETGCDCVVLHNDAWAFRETIKELANEYVTITYSPIDGGKISPEEFDAIASATERVAMCKYVENELTKIGLSSTYIPHGVDTKVFNPQSKDEWREKFTLPKDEFIIGFVGTNISKRKGQAEMLMAAKMALDAGKKFKIVCITNIDGVQQGGYNFWRLADYLGVPRDVLLFPSNSFSFTEEEMAGWYNSFDILVNVTRGEGFGIPILESMACGTPAMATDFSSMTELVDGHGILIPVLALDIYTLKNQFLAIPDYNKFGEELIKLIDNHDVVESMGKRACQFAQKYDWDHITPSWDRLFRRIDSEGHFPPYRTAYYK